MLDTKVKRYKSVQFHSGCLSHLELPSPRPIVYVDRELVSLSLSLLASVGLLPWLCLHRWSEVARRGRGEGEKSNLVLK